MAREGRRRRPVEGDYIYGENYTVAYAVTVDELVAQVQALQDAGWQVTGGIATLPRGGPVLTGSYFYQALVLPPADTRE